MTLAPNHVSKCSVLAQWSWCCICPLQNLSPGFPFCLFVPLWAWEGILTPALPSRDPAVFLSSVQTTSMLQGRGYLRSPLPPFWKLSNLVCLLSSVMGGGHLPFALSPSWDCPNCHCFYAETYHSNQVFPGWKFNHLFNKYLVSVYVPKTNKQKKPVLVTKQTGILFALQHSDPSRGHKKY